MKNIIEIINLTKDYGDNKGVFDLNLNIKKGEVMGFLGSNGAGKTTTLRHLMGFIKADSGSVRINGMSCFKNSAQVQKNVGYLPGETAFFDDMTGEQFIKFIAAMRNISDLSRAKYLMEYFEFSQKGKIRKMSKGTKQKVALVCAFFHDPKVYLLDEPTSGLDPLMQNKFIELIKEEKAKGKTILMSSHMFDEVARTCDKAAIIRSGKLMGVYSASDLQAKVSRTYKIVFNSEKSIEHFVNTWGESAKTNGMTAIVKIEGVADKFIKAIAQYEIIDIDVQAGASEELFLQLYEKEI